MKRHQLTQGSLVLGLLCTGVLVAALLIGQQSVSAQREVLPALTPMLLGQAWSSQQQEVWNTVKSLWEAYAKKDIERALSYVHTDFRGWHWEDPLPRDKAGERRWATYFSQIQQELVQDLKPVAIDIHDNFALVHYYYTKAYKDTEGKHQTEGGRWTDIYMKEGGTWLLICDHGGPDPARSK